MQHCIIVDLPASVSPGTQVLVRVYLEEPGWPDGTVEVDLRPASVAVWTPIRLLPGARAEVRNEGRYVPGHRLWKQMEHVMPEASPEEEGEQ
jgi:hypothetical protein